MKSLNFQTLGSWDGADDKERGALRVRLTKENEDDEEIASDDDDEIDSDVAFEETDEERFAVSHKRKRKSKSANKGEQDEEEGEDNEFIDLVLDVLDGKGEIDTGSDSEKPSNHPAEEPINDEVDRDDPPEDEEMPEALDQLNEFVSNLKKRKAALALVNVDW